MSLWMDVLVFGSWLSCCGVSTMEVSTPCQNSNLAGSPTVAQNGVGSQLSGRMVLTPTYLLREHFGSIDRGCLDTMSFGHGIMSTFTGAYVDRSCMSPVPS